ncbi:MAG: hypothetical protein KatS3mg121_0866 [Gammaproteobacteria bacterium]|nr:MAG: hypothetical protein KatS3mg121_0866 [Gammaproteobacteria bacterium]
MARVLKAFVFGVVVGVVLGLWAGVNIGKGRPVWGNPFAEKPVTEKLRDAGGAVLERSGEVLQRGAERLKGAGHSD